MHSGNVEYQSDFRILKPLDLDRGNGCLVYDVPNRGNQPIMPRLNGAPDGGHPQHAGNGFLMRRGFTRGVERLAGRRAAWQRSPDRALSDHPRHHRHGAGGVHRREHRAARRQQHPGAVRGALRRHARLSGCRPERCDVDGAASARPIRASRRPVLHGVWSTTGMSRSRGRPRRASTAARFTSSSTAPAIRS